MTDWTVENLARAIDHCLLHPMLDDRQLVKGLAVAVECNCVSVCIKPYFVEMTARLLDGTGILTGTVVGFPHGGNTTLLKIEEAKRAVDEGAEEIDMVVNIGKVRSCEWGYVRDEIGGVNACAMTYGASLKVIFETECLSDAMIGQLCRICNDLQPAFVAPSTGFVLSDLKNRETGIGMQHLAMIRDLLSGDIGLKAGGIHSLDELLTARALGASRFGTIDTGGILRAAAERLDQEE